MQLTTTRFGAIEIEPDAILTFTQPIIGFEQRRRFVILPGPSGGFVKWLQSADAPDLAFLIMDPRSVIDGYTVQVCQSDLTELGAGSPGELDLYTLVVVPRDRTQIRTNLKAPLLINPRQRLGKQTILDSSDYPVQYFLARGAERNSQGAQRTAQEVK